jgi:hypothetical protein
MPAAGRPHDGAAHLGRAAKIGAITSMRNSHAGTVRTAFAAALLAWTMLAAGQAWVHAHAEHGHPARIHEGTCEALGPVAFRLNGVGGSVDLDGAPLATPAAVNPSSSYQVMASETVITTPIDDLLAGGHALMLYESDEEMSAIACGNLGGAMVGETLVTGLGEVGVPGHTGFALFASTADTTTVTILIGHAMAPVSAGGPVEVDGVAAEQSADHADDEAEHDHEEEEDDHASDATPTS